MAQSSSSPLVWLVTGCSSGMGADFIRAILKNGDKAIATARKPETLQGLAELGAATLQLDVSASAAELKTKINEAIGIYGHIDVLISNAGNAELGPVELSGDGQLLKQLQTNTFAAVNLIAAIMPHWRERKQGFFIANSSMSAWYDVVPGLGLYAASKASLTRLVEAFGAEVRPGFPNIRTLVLHVGAMRTDIASAEKIQPALARTWESYNGIRDFWTDFRPKLDGHQGGDSYTACSVTVNLVRSEIVGDQGVAGGQHKPLPSLLAFGSDAFDAIKERAEKDLKMIKEWEDVIKSSDIGGVSARDAQTNE